MERLTKVSVSNLDKVLYPDLGLTKAHIIEYYIKVAPRIIPFITQRALVRTRYPDGIGVEGFYEKDAPRGTPDWVRIYTKYSESAAKDTEYVVCDDVDTLIWLANLAALELHIPSSRVPLTDIPDWVLFDMDPEPPAGLREAVQGAFLLKEALDDMGLKSYVKNSGRKGVHVVVPLEPLYTFDVARGFVHSVGVGLAESHEFIVSERSQTREPGTVLVDYPQNSEHATMVAPYSLRAVREATVSTPLEWGELASLRAFDHNIFNVPDRRKEPWKKMMEEPQKLPSL